MLQTNIFDYLNVPDPVQERIVQLKAGEQFVIHEASIGYIEIRLNNRSIYEVETAHYHDPFSSVEDCYRRVCTLLEKGHVPYIQQDLRGFSFA